VKIKFWGTRGSIPVPDRRMMRYGGNTTCVEVTLGEKTLIIDAGTGIRLLGEQILRRKINDLTLFLTHSHWDHIQGFPFFKPIYSKKTSLTILGCTDSYNPLKNILARHMSSEYFPVPFDELAAKINFVNTCGGSYAIAGHTLRFIRTNHPSYTLGVRIEKGNSSFVFLTDNELESEKPVTSFGELRNFCRGASLLVHDAQFTTGEYPARKGWGHSTFEQAIELAHAAGVKKLGLTHHDPTRKDTELDAIANKIKTTCRKKSLSLLPVIIKESSSILI